MHPIKNTIGTKQLVGFYISSILGAGILVVPGIAVQQAGPGSILAWAALILFSFPIAYSFIYIASAAPGSGGITNVIYKALGSRLGKWCGLLICIAMVLGNPFLGLSVAHYFNEIVTIPSKTTFATIAFITMLFCVLYNFQPLKKSTSGQAFVTTIIVGVLLLVCILSLPNVDMNKMSPLLPYGWHGVGSAIVVGFYSFLGWENVVTISNDVDNPVPKFKRAFLISIGLISVLYLMLSFLLVTAQNSASQGGLSILANLLPQQFGFDMTIPISLFAIVIILVSGNAWVLGAAKMVSSLASKGLLPSALAQKPDQTAPRSALVFLLACYALTLSVYSYTSVDEAALVGVVNGLFGIVYVVSFIAGFLSDASAKRKLLYALSLALSLGFIVLLGKKMILVGTIAAVSFIAVLAVGYTKQRLRSSP